MAVDTNQKIVQIDGGIGRVLCAEPALSKLSQDYKVTVLTSWPEIFFNHPKIHKTYNLNREYLFDDVVQHGVFVSPEPYFSHHYYAQDHHLIESFNFLLNGKADMSRPTVYLTPDEKAKAKKRVKELKDNLGVGRPLVALQTFGSSAKIEDDVFSDPTFRSLDVERTLQIVDHFKDFIFVNCSFIPIDRPNVANPRFSTRELIAVLEHVDHIFTVDSFLAHAAYLHSKKAFQMLGGTFAENVSYKGEFEIVQKPGYPKSYHANRISGFLEKNQDAMTYTDEEFKVILARFEEFAQPKVG